MPPESFNTIFTPEAQAFSPDPSLLTDIDSVVVEDDKSSSKLLFLTSLLNEKPLQITRIPSLNLTEYVIDEEDNGIADNDISSILRSSRVKAPLTKESLTEREDRYTRLRTSIGRISTLNLIEPNDIDTTPRVRRSPGVVLDDYFTILVDTPDSAEEGAVRERAAHRFRSTRIRSGVLGSIVRELQGSESTVLKAGVVSVVKRGKNLTEGTFEEGERHRLYAPLIAALYGTPETREKLINGIDENVANETRRLKEEAREAKKAGEQMAVEWLIVGSGMHGSIAAAELRSQLPKDRIVMIDKSEKLGGQFANYGDRPVFFGNSRAHRKQKSGTTELPGGDGNINPFGPHAPVQLPDLTRKTYWTNTEMADSIKLNGYLSAEAMQQTDVVSVEYVRGVTSSEDTYKVRMKDTVTGEEIEMSAKNIVVTTGLGERIALAEAEITKDEGFLSVEDLLKKFADKNNQFPMDEFEGKRIAVVGGGDSARIAMELFARLAPDAAYGRSSVQLGDGPESIDWFGVGFFDRDGFCAENRPRYNQLASFIDRQVGDSLIHPKPSTKVTSVTKGKDGITLGFTSNNGARTAMSEAYDYVIDATTLVSRANDPFDGIDGRQIPVRSRSIYSISESTVYGQQIAGHRIVFAGPAAKSPLTGQEKKTFAQGIRENTTALWANGPRTIALVDGLVKVARRARRGDISIASRSSII